MRAPPTAAYAAYAMSAGCVLASLASPAAFADVQDIISNEAPVEAAAHAAPVAPPGVADTAEAGAKKEQFTVVPIPLSDPTLGSGLVAAGLYFHAQTAEEAKVQPATLTAAFALATDNGSRVAGVAHASYWDADRWRFSGIAGYGHLNLDFFGAGSLTAPQEASARWTVDATIVHPKLYRQFDDHWYAGAQMRYVDARQTFGTATGIAVPLAENITSVGAGLMIERDTRDNQFNAYSGSLFQFDALFNRTGLGSDGDYNAVTVRWRTYFSLSSTLVLAVDTRGCSRTGEVPLFDACFLQLRGFPLTRYIGNAMAIAQAEFRWRVAGPVGLVAFAGMGTVASRPGELRFDPASAAIGYGVGVRYMLLDSQRINLSVDLARGGGSNALYVSVAEAF